MEMTIISDKVYGEVEVNEEVLLELMDSAPLQRLKKIDQHGARSFVFTNGSVSRYDHCVGVMLLLRKLGASIEEQIAGLLHDVPHTAFSHVIDYVFEKNNDEQEFHERFFEKVVMCSDVPEILLKHGFDVKRVINEKLFNLLEKSGPDLCADRLDYSFRDFIAFYGKDGRCERFISHLIVHDNEIIFNDVSVGLEFAEHYLWMGREQWSHELNVASYHYLAKALKRALGSHVINFEDLFSTDDAVMKKLRSSKDPIISENLSYLVPTLKVETCNEDEADINSMAKLRYVDPKILLLDGFVKRVSESHPELLEMIEKHKLRTSEGVHLKVLSK
ncbi:hypothetical protein CL619_00555 [archaeon]|nr:hypothetical protein [archaeon]|tara:strand:- start:334 stop:1329 length:996 start_codon:yes stop_codon:yes gene_type:complete